jgi:hypothetical protein
MATSLYDLSVPTFLQTVSAVAGFLDRAVRHCAETAALLGPIPFADLRAMIAEAEAALKALTPDEVNGWSGKNLDFQIGPRRLAFTPETFLLSFSLPNFHFHAVTAYDILRTRGVPLGKRDYEGRLRTRSA